VDVMQHSAVVQIKDGRTVVQHGGRREREREGGSCEERMEEPLHSVRGGRKDIGSHLPSRPVPRPVPSLVPSLPVPPLPVLTRP
jgi:hypothetical protein